MPDWLVGAQYRSDDCCNVTGLSVNKRWYRVMLTTMVIWLHRVLGLMAEKTVKPGLQSLNRVVIYSFTQDGSAGGIHLA